MNKLVYLVMIFMLLVIIVLVVRSPFEQSQQVAPEIHDHAVGFTNYGNGCALEFHENVDWVWDSYRGQDGTGDGLEITISRESRGVLTITFDNGDSIQYTIDGPCSMTRMY